MIRTKIICTVGPSVATPRMIEQLASAGMSLMRINGSHGSPPQFSRHLKNIRTVERKIGKPLAVMMDLQGPKLRVGDLTEPLKLREDEIWRIIPGASPNAEKRVIPVKIPEFSRAVKTGSDIFMDDGLIRLRVLRILNGAVEVKIIHGGILEARKGINIPYYRGSMAPITAKDKIDLAWALDNSVDFVALSFVRKAQDIQALRRLVLRANPHKMPLLIAKIEKPEAVDNLDEIIAASDAVLVARGDLGIELAPEKVPVVQKIIIEKSRVLKKPVIVATQMLDSMRHNPIPTRAEASDVASTIFAGADAVLLTGETSSGKYPVAATHMLKKIIAEVEDLLIQKTFRKTPGDFGMTGGAEAVIFNAMTMADDIGAKAIVMLTRKGELTTLMSKLHPKQPIFSIAPNLRDFRHLNLLWGVFPIAISKLTPAARIEHGLAALRRMRVARAGDAVIFLYRDYQSANLNLKIVRV